MINLRSSENWTDEAKISEDAIQKDLCHECYKTIAQLIGVKSAVEEQVSINRPRDGRKQPLDKETIKELWARGLTYRQIADRMFLKVHQVNYVISCLTEEERIELREKYSAHKTDNQEDHNTIDMKVTTDATGCVISIE